MKNLPCNNPGAGCRWASKGWEGVKAAGRLFNALAAKDQWGRPVRVRPYFFDECVLLLPSASQLLTATSFLCLLALQLWWCC